MIKWLEWVKNQRAILLLQKCVNNKSLPDTASNLKGKTSIPIIDQNENGDEDGVSQ